VRGKKRVENVELQIGRRLGGRHSQLTLKLRSHAFSFYLTLNVGLRKLANPVPNFKRNAKLNSLGSFYRATTNAYAQYCVAFLSVCLSVRLSDACFVTKRNNLYCQNSYTVYKKVIHLVF